MTSVAKMGGTSQNKGRYVLEMMTIHSDMIRILFETLKEILQDVNICFDSNGMKIAAMDPTKVAFVHLKLNADDIRSDGGHYYCECDHNPDGSEIKRTLGVNLGNLFKIIKMVTKDDSISFFVERGDEQHLGVKIENRIKNLATTIKYKLYDLNQDDISIQDFEFDTEIAISSNDFTKHVRDMSHLSSIMEIRTTGDQLRFSCQGDWADQTTIIGENSNLEFVQQTDEVIQGRFSIRFLQLFTKATNLCIRNKLFLKNNYPLIIEYPVPNLGSLKFLLGQQVEGD